MRLSTVATGTSGTLKIEDHTDDPEYRSVELYIRTDVSIDEQQIAWWYATDIWTAPVMSFTIESGNTDWQLLRGVWVGDDEEFTLYLGDTNTTELGGPTSLNVELLGGSLQGESSYLKADGLYERAKPHVRVDGVWKPAVAYTKVDGLWQQAM